MTTTAMFLHSGAGLHGHEYSSRDDRHASSQTPSHERHRHRHRHHDHDHDTQPRPLPLLRSALRPFTDINDPRLSADATAQSPSDARRSFTDPPPSSPSQPRRSVSDVISKKDHSVRFQEPHMSSAAPSIATLPSEDEDSAAGSELNDSADVPVRRKRRKRCARKTTRYVLANPAPQLRTKQRMLVQFRPRLLLQLQELGDHRPTPAFDILPSSTVTSSILIPKLAKRWPRIFSAKTQLGPDDLVIARSEDYSAAPSLASTDSNHGRLDSRDLMAVVSPLPQHGDDYAEIVMGDGSTWTTSPMANGSYESTRVDDRGVTTTARWVRKPIRTSKSPADSADVSSLSTPPSPVEKWTFSILNPSTRRHPIMGVLTAQELTIYDTYSTMSASSGRFPPTKPFHSPLGSPEDSTPHVATPTREGRSTEVVPEEYKQLMMATASWIRLRLEGWPASANPKLRRSIGHGRSASSSLTERRRTFPLSDSSSGPLNSSILPICSKIDDSTTPPSGAATPRRAVSTSAAFMRSRQRTSESIGVKEKPEDTKRGHSPVQTGMPDSGPVAEVNANTCRLKLRRWTQKVFRRKSYQVR